MELMKRAVSENKIRAQQGKLSENKIRAQQGKCVENEGHSRVSRGDIGEPIYCLRTLRIS